MLRNHWANFGAVASLSTIAILLMATRTCDQAGGLAPVRQPMALKQRILILVRDSLKGAVCSGLQRAPTSGPTRECGFALDSANSRSVLLSVMQSRARYMAALFRL